MIHFSLRFLFWLFFQLQSWRAWCKYLSPALSPDFSWLQYAHKPDAKLGHALLAMYGILPLLVGGVTVFSLGFTVIWQEQADIWVFARGFIYAAMLSLFSAVLLGMLVSVAFGLVVGIFGGFLVGMLYGVEPAWSSRILLVAFFAIGIGGSVLLDLSIDAKPPVSVMRRLSAILASVLLTFLIFSLNLALWGVIANVLINTLSLQLNLEYVWLGGLVSGLFLSLGLATRYWRQAIFGALFCGGCLVLLWMLGEPLEGSRPGQSLLGAGLTALFLSLLFVPSYQFACRFADVYAGLWAGALSSVGLYSAYVLITDKLANTWLLLALAMPLFILGLWQKYWRAIIFYPFELLHGTLWLYRQDEEAWKYELKLTWEETALSRHAAFWDQQQFLLLRDLHAHLHLLAKHQRELLPTALQLLDQTPQKKIAMQLREELRLTDRHIENPYISGVPLDENCQVFVGRQQITDEIRELLTAPYSPPLLLHGQRRMGKTSLLKHLQHFLQDPYLPIWIDLQSGWAAGGKASSFFYRLAKTILRGAKKHHLELPALTRKDLQDDAFLQFEEWLDAVEVVAGEQRVFLLCLDEFAVLDQGFNKGTLDRDFVLGFLRHISQHRQSFRLLFSDALRLEQLVGWTTYFPHIRSLKLDYLTFADAQQLIEYPTPGFVLQYTREAVQSLWDLTCGHPDLLQALCYELVRYKNKQSSGQRSQVKTEDVKNSIERVLTAKSETFRLLLQARNAIQAQLLQDIAHGQCAWPALPSQAVQAALQDLQQRDIITVSKTETYCFQVELMRLWVLESLSENNMQVV